MFHFRLFYYLILSIVVITLLGVSLSILKRDSLKKPYIYFLAYILFSFIHLFLIFFMTYYSNFIGNSGIFSLLAVSSHYLRGVMFILFGLTIINPGKKLFYTLFIIISLVFLTGVIGYFLNTLFIYIILLFYYLDDDLGEVRVIVKYQLISGFITMPFIFSDIIEEYFPGSPFANLNIDFFPLCVLIIIVMFILGLVRKRRVERREVSLDLEMLSKREGEVALEMIEGLSNRDIAEKLFISESTVKKHINSIFKKLSVKSRWELLKLSNSP